MKRAMVGAFTSVLLLAGASACRPRPAGVEVPSASAQQRVATVFTDTTLFRKMCTEADSGLAPVHGRCTPRDQGLRLVRPIP